MPDTKITALTALTAADPANDVLPIVDVSDTTMAASGTTKKISINNVLGCSGTATLASATITGDLTVDTSTLKVDSANNRVGVGTASPTRALSVVGSAVATYANINSGDNTSLVGLLLGGTSTPSAGQVIYDNTANSLAFFTSGATQMTLNSTGLGVGASPNISASGKALTISGAFTRSRLELQNTDGGTAGVTCGTISWFNGSNAIADITGATNSGSATLGSLAFSTGGSPRLTIDSTGNVGIGVTPSTVWTANGNLQVGVHAALYTNASLGATDFAYNSIRTGSDTYQYSFATSLAASRLQQRDGSFRFFTAPAGTSPNAITFIERLRLKETGQLRFVPLAADPAGAEAGDVYYNSSSNKLKCYNGTTWNDLF